MKKTELHDFSLENDKLMDPELARSYMFQMTCVSFERFFSRFCRSLRNKKA